MKQTVLIYIEKDNKFLMLYRNKKDNDINKNKYIGIGGKVEENETLDQALIREVKEETGLNLLSYSKSGIVYFIYNGDKEEMHVYTSSEFEGKVTECNEGELYWVEKEKVLSLKLWEGDKYFLKKILNNETNYVISLYYENDKLVKVVE